MARRFIVISALCAALVTPPRAHAFNNDDFRNVVMGTTSTLGLALLLTLVVSAVQEKERKTPKESQPQPPVFPAPNSNIESPVPLFPPFQPQSEKK
jgi:hypothetical protein